MRVVASHQIGRIVCPLGILLAATAVIQVNVKPCLLVGGRRNPFGRQAVRPPPKPFRAKEAGDLGLPVGKDRADPAVITLNTHRSAGAILLWWGLSSSVKQAS